MKTTASLAALGLAWLLASAPARAQSDADASVPSNPSPNDSLGVIRLTPPAPDGGIYGAPEAPSTGTPAPTTAPPTTTTATPTTATPTTATTPTTLAPTVIAPSATTPAPAAPANGMGTLVLPPPPPQATLVMPEPFGVPHRRNSLARQRLRLLDSMLPPLAERSRSQRLMDGVISMVTGGVIGGIGFLPDSIIGPTHAYFWAAGGVELASGIVTLAWVPARETLTSQFMAMPMATAAQRRARLRFGEHALEDMAADGARRRVLGAVGNAALPVGLLALVYVPTWTNGTTWTPGPFDYVVFGLTGVEVVLGLIQLFGRSEEERLWTSYRQQVQLMQSEQQGVGP